MIVSRELKTYSSKILIQSPLKWLKKMRNVKEKLTALGTELNFWKILLLAKQNNLLKKLGPPGLSLLLGPKTS